MDFAIDLSTGKTYKAFKVSYTQAKTLKLVCSVCKEKVFKRVRNIPNETHMFAHHKGGSPDCELYFPSVSDASSGTNEVGISRGQTFEKFISDISSVRTLFEQIQLISRKGLNIIGDGFVK